MIAELEAAICQDLGAIPGVASAKPYAGELDEGARAMLRLPALLLALARLGVDADRGSGEIHTSAYFSLFVCTRHAGTAEQRGDDAWSLAEAVLLRLHGAQWGLSGVSPALIEEPDTRSEQPLVMPSWALEDRGVAVREVRWRQRLMISGLNTPWTGEGVTPREVYLGQAPEIGLGNERDYTRIEPWGG